MRIVWLKTELLHPVDRGGRIRTYQMLRALRKEHHVTYVALDDGTSAPDAIERAQEYAHEVVRLPFSQPARRSLAFGLAMARNLASPLPYSLWRYRNDAMRQYISGLTPANADVLVCDFLFPWVNMPQQVAVPTVLFQHNVEAMIWERMAANASGLKRAYLALQHRRLAAAEAAACRSANRVVAVSEEDAVRMATDYDVADVRSVPTGVDTEFFTPPDAPRSLDELVFVGAMDWLPNEDGVAFLLDEILPKIRAKHPHVRVTIVGRNPSDALRRSASALPMVTITGTVPDIRPYLHRAALFIVPLRIGGGTRLKIYEAMAAGAPVVSTTIGAEGLPLDDRTEIRLADGADAFSAAVSALLDDAPARAALAHAGATRVHRDFGWTAVAHAFADHCQIPARKPSEASSLPDQTFAHLAS